jgi:DNA-directed RNA polymerase subunit RPC12/RpoP
MNQNQNTELETILANSEDVVCACGSKHFIPATNLKKVSAIMSPTGKEEYAQLGVLICFSCGQKFEKPKIII